MDVTLTRVIETCAACPSQWDAWDTNGQYWYLRYRHSNGTAERHPGPDYTTWENRAPDIRFSTDRGRHDGWIDLDEFLELAGLRLAPDAEVRALLEP